MSGMRSTRCKAAGVTALVVLALLPLAASQSCGSIDALGLGRAKGDGTTDDAPSIAAMEADSTIGLIYLPSGTFRLGSNVTLTKPLMAEAGALFKLDAAATLTLVSQPEHPLTAFFSGSGDVVFADGTIRAFPEWWGAKGDGISDDSGAVQAAYDAAAARGNAMLYLSSKVYGIGKGLVFPPGATIMAEPGARLKAVGGNGQGLTFTAGGFAYKNVLPHLEGFSDFCMRLQGADLGAFQMQTLSGCGDAIRLEATRPADPALGDYGTVLDNTVWFDTITNSRSAIAFIAGAHCERAGCIYQGNHIIGNKISGCGPAASPTTTMLFYSPSIRPAWDSNQLDFGEVGPCPAANWRLMSVNSGSESNREVIKIGKLGAVAPGGKLFEGTHNVLQMNINLSQQLPEASANLVGQLNLVEFTGATTPPAGAPRVRAATKPASKPTFNGGRALLGNYFQLTAVPATDWAPGEIRQFFVYHQFATGLLYQIKCDAAKLATTGLPAVACTQAQDSGNEELQLWLINMTGSTLKGGGTGVPFSLAVATLGNP